jgi:CDP-diacylglycerol---serine O-phosphatidyltransferase
MPPVGEPALARVLFSKAGVGSTAPWHQIRRLEPEVAPGFETGEHLQACANVDGELKCCSMPSDPQRHFSMLRDFRAADFFTLGNGFAGCGAILAFMRFCTDGQTRFFWIGTALLPVALLMDILDGRVARLRHEASPLGQELDSLADIVSFGVAPAAMAFACGMRGEGDALCLTFFVACGISRLARYNVTAASLSTASGKVRYFEGMPIPSSLLLVLLLGILFAMGHRGSKLSVWQLGSIELHPLALLYLAHGSAMISKTLRIPKL